MISSTCNEDIESILPWKHSIFSFLVSRFPFTSFFVLSIYFTVKVTCIVLCFFVLQGNRRETRLLGILSFVHSTIWKVLFGKVNSCICCANCFGSCYNRTLELLVEKFKPLNIDLKSESLESLAGLRSCQLYFANVTPQFYFILPLIENFYFFDKKPETLDWELLESCFLDIVFFNGCRLRTIRKLSIFFWIWS